MSTKPVVVYGASGYTGRLVCEYLREHNIPFVAAGRNKDRLASSMELARRSLFRPAATNGMLCSRRYSQTSLPVYPEAP